MENELIIRHRLLTGTSTTRGEPPLKKLALALIAFSKNIPAAQQEKQHRNLCSEIANIEFLARRQVAVQAACAREAQRYGEKRAEVHDAIRSAEADIEAAKAALLAAQVVRQHEEQYEAKKQDIVQVMGRVATAAEAQKVMGEVSSIQADSLQADDTLTLGRRKQFAALLHSLEMLQAAMDQEGGCPPAPLPHA
ncbi:hypothetical protein WJX75_009154 [Coccomyxa subellipsoidea]|uniref:Uncharacterized protein n=1 Tax=Coccomyxa subellipsoidea TaxID=248742 RepID=A0ABR2YDR7_9CHLO